MVKIKCEVCREMFEAKRNTAKYCSDKCRKLAFQEKEELRKAVKEMGAQELYDGIDSYEHDGWVDSPEHEELMERLNSYDVDRLKEEGYHVPVWKEKHESVK